MVKVTVGDVVPAGAALETKTVGNPLLLAHTESKSEFRKRRTPCVCVCVEMGVMVWNWWPPR
jgi:hypothetical protein